MLQRLQIQNYALIEKLDIELHSGFSVITGETGAGKSIILGALGLILGQRADAKAIKPGARSCIVEAVFDLSHYDLRSLFEENDLDYDNECILRRELSETGKSRAFINDTPVQLSTLKAVGSKLIDIHSQHQNLLLQEATFQQDVLDTMARSGDLLQSYQEVFQTWQASLCELREFEENIERERRDADYNRFQWEEINKAQLEAGEQAELEAESALLANSEGIKQSLFQASDALSTDDVGIIDRLHSGLHALESVSDVYAPAKALYERLESCSIELEDIAQELSQQMEQVKYDPKRQIYVDDRLATIYALQKKYSCSDVESLLSLAESLRARLDNVDNSAEKLEELRTQCSAQEQSALKFSVVLTKKRKSVVPQVETAMKDRLQALGMPNIRFQVELSPVPLSLRGADQVQFLFSANAGQSLQPISNVASGGEISRVMLSLKALLVSRIPLPTLIFDEIDTGVSGRVAEQMALMMKSMCNGFQQVISITHLPQIAACGQHQYNVYKNAVSGVAATHIRLLTPEERVTAIAHLLSGTALTDAAIRNAQELLKSDDKENDKQK